MVKSVLDHRNELVVARYRPEDKRLRMRLMGGRKGNSLIAAYKSARLQRDRISIAELNKVPFIGPINGSATRDIIVEHLGQFKVSPRVVIETGSIALTKRLVQQDERIGFMCRDGVAGSCLGSVLGRFISCNARLVSSMASVIWPGKISPRHPSLL